MTQPLGVPVGNVGGAGCRELLALEALALLLRGDTDDALPCPREVSPRPGS